MTRPRAWAALGAATLVLCACGKAGGGAASGQAAASGAPPAASAAAASSDVAVSSAAAAALPPVAVASAPAPTVRPAAVAAPAPPRREPTAAELLHDDPRYIARAHRIDQLYGNARERDPTGQVDHEQAAAMAELHACVDKACLDAWMSRREAALSQYVGN